MAQPNGILNMYTRERDCWTIHFSCRGAGAANPTGLVGTGVVSVVRTGTGLYTLTLKDSWPGLLNIGISVLSNSGTRIDVYATNAYNLTTKLIYLQSLALGVATDLATTDYMKGTMEFSNSVQKPWPYTSP